jgi:hypothetical protein
MPQLYWIIPLESSPGAPTHPIAPGGPPLGIWGGPPLYPDQGLPGQQPGVSHPIAPGGRPPGIWGGPPLYPDQGLPGSQPHPDQGLPGSQPHPSHPIWIGPPTSTPDPEPVVEWHTAWSQATGWIVVGIPNVPAPAPSA